MRIYALALLIVAVLGAIFGFGMAVSVFTGLAKIFFYLAVIGFFVMVAMYFTRGRV